MEPVYETLNVGNVKTSVQNKFVVEKSTNLSSSKKILSVSASAFSLDSAVDGGLYTYNGRVVFYVCYLDENGEIKKFETAENFSEKQAIDPDTCSIVMNVSVQKTDFSFKDDVLTLKAYLLAMGEASKCQTVSAFSGGDNVVLDKEEIEYSKSLGQKGCDYPVEEEFSLNYAVKDVVVQNVDASITSVQSGIGAIIVDGEAYLRLLFLISGEKSDIIKEERTIPFRVEIECDDALPQMTATASVCIKGLKTDVSVEEDTGKSTVSALVNLGFKGEVFALERTEILRDAFSTTEEIEIEKSHACVYSPDKCEYLSAKVSGRAMVDELPFGEKVSSTCDEKFEVTAFSCENGVLSVDGALSMKVYLTGDDGTRACYLETPVSFSLECALVGCDEKDILVVVKNSYARLISLTEIEIGANLGVSVKARDKREISFIEKVKVLGAKPTCDFPISVYLTTAGEELWSLSKRLRVSPEKLIETNKDLQFPLTGKERIVIYRQK